IAAVLLAPDLAKPDQAYPTMMRLLPMGILGLVFAALTAAIVASAASKINSIGTIFTLDIYRKARGSHFAAVAEGTTEHAADAPAAKRYREERHLVLVGRLSAVAATLIAMAAARPLLGSSDQAFQFIQEYTGFFTPGITVIFLLGLFWKRASEAGALAGAIGSLLLSILLAQVWQSLPFMNRWVVVFFAALALAVVVSLAVPQRRIVRIVTDDVDYRTSSSFNALAVGVLLILIALYACFW
ncbi:MAG TPA: sodium transporter, partial [Sphingomonas sp.]